MDNGIFVVHPELEDDWNYKKNSKIDPSNISFGSNRNVWWKCHICGYEWEASPNNRTKTKNSGCPACVGKVLLRGRNDLETWCHKNLKEDILEQWDKEKNYPIEPSDITRASNKEVMWKCSLAHSWPAKVCARTLNNTGCPYCSNKKVLPGFNDLETLFPSISEEWHAEKNGQIKPNTVLAGSNKKYWWKCLVCGYEWHTSPYERTAHRCGCGVCAGKVPLKGHNDLETWCLSNDHPDLLKEWDYVRNDKSPCDFLPNSNKEVHWICKKCQYEWTEKIYNRTARGFGCSVCSGKRVCVGVNDLQTWCIRRNDMQLIEEWDYELNEDISPTDVTYGSARRINWRCNRGHRWKASVADRTIKHVGCKLCSCNQTSFPEQAIAYYLSKSHFILQRKKISGVEVDVFLPDYNIAIEYDGLRFHNQKTIEIENKKKNTLSASGIKLIRVKETEETTRRVDNIIYYHTKGNYLTDEFDSAISLLAKYIEEVTGVKSSIIPSVIDDELNIRNHYYSFLRDGSVSKCSPEIVAEWDIDKNCGLLPDYFSNASNVSVWWRCPKGHSYQARISKRTVSHQGCSICSKKVIVSGVNDLATWCHDSDMDYLIDEWDYDNNTFLPDTVSYGSKREVMWKCKLGHSWTKSIYSRTVNKSKCPYCSDKKLLVGFNDFETWCRKEENDSLMLDWDYEKNEINPSNIMWKSWTPVAWKCHKCEYMWMTELANRTTQGYGCFICSRKHQ